MNYERKTNDAHNKFLLRLAFLLLLLCTLLPAQALILPSEQHQNISIYNTDIERPEKGEPFYKLLGTIGNSTQYNITEVVFTLTFYREEEPEKPEGNPPPENEECEDTFYPPPPPPPLFSRTINLYIDIPSGNTKDFLEKLILPLKEKEEFYACLEIKHVKGVLPTGR